MTNRPANPPDNPLARPSPNRPVVIGLTGGIASGKTTVSGMLAARGAWVIDADRVGHQVIQPDGEAYAEVVAAFGSSIVEESGAISRKALGALVFGDPRQLAALNAISHPRMAQRMEREIAEVRRRPPEARPPLIVLDAAILFEAGWDALCGRVWTVQATPETAMARLMDRNDLSREEARARLDAQMSNDERALRSARVIANEGSLQDLELAIAELWREETGLPP